MSRLNKLKGYIPYGLKKKFPSLRKKNPTKAQRAVASQKAAAERREAVALAKYLKQQNPSAKLAGAKVEKLKGGVLKITPIKMNAAGGGKGRKISIEEWDGARRRVFTRVMKDGKVKDGGQTWYVKPVGGGVYHLAGRAY